MSVPAYSVLTVSALVFAIGIYGLLTSRNMIRMLLSAEVIFNASLLALLTLSLETPHPGPVLGGDLALLSIAIAAAEVGVMVSVAVLMFRLKSTLDIYELKTVEG